MDHYTTSIRLHPTSGYQRRIRLDTIFLTYILLFFFFFFNRFSYDHRHPQTFPVDDKRAPSIYNLQRLALNVGIGSDTGAVL